LWKVMSLIKIRQYFKQILKTYLCDELWMFYDASIIVKKIGKQKLGNKMRKQSNHNIIAVISKSTFNVITIFLSFISQLYKLFVLFYFYYRRKWIHISRITWPIQPKPSVLGFLSDKRPPTTYHISVRFKI